MFVNILFQKLPNGNGQIVTRSVSAGREFWPFRVIFFQKVERSCGQTVKDRFYFSIDLGQLCL